MPNGFTNSLVAIRRRQHILEAIDCDERDFQSLATHSAKYPTPDFLRSITKQGETEIAPYPGTRELTAGAQWIVRYAQRNDPRPLHVLIWRGIKDLAQALHDAPDILPKSRVHYIGGPNKKCDSTPITPSQRITKSCGS